MSQEVVSLRDSNPNIRVTGNAPPMSKSGQIEGHDRRRLCETSFFTNLCMKDGKKMRGKWRGLRERTTMVYCMGRQYFGNLPPWLKKDDGIDELNMEIEIIEVHLGSKRKWKLIGNRTSGGRFAKRNIEMEFSVSMKKTCTNLAREHQLRLYKYCR